MKEIFRKIDELADEYIGVWEDVLNIESPSSFKEGVDEVGKYFIRIAEKNGWKVEIFPQEKFGDVITIIMNPDAKNASVCFSGHMDTVHEIGFFGNPPVKKDDKNIYDHNWTQNLPSNTSSCDAIAKKCTESNEYSR